MKFDWFLWKSFTLWFQLIGSPEDSDLGFLRSDNARRYIRQLPRFPRQPLAQKFPNLQPAAVDLIEHMLRFDPAGRITGQSFSHVEPLLLVFWQNFSRLVHAWHWPSPKGAGDVMSVVMLAGQYHSCCLWFLFPWGLCFLFLLFADILLYLKSLSPLDHPSILFRLN